jgi:transcriptional regulator with XRE-family HTH domain
MRKAENSGEIGMRLKDIRMQMRVGQREMAKILKIAPSYLCEIESGRANPGPEFFVRLVKHYNVNLNYLFVGVGNIQNGSGDVPNTQEVKIGKEIDSIEEMLWLMQHSKFFKTSILGQANIIINKQPDVIVTSLERNKETD